MPPKSKKTKVATPATPREAATPARVAKKPVKTGGAPPKRQLGSGTQWSQVVDNLPTPTGEVNLLNPPTAGDVQRESMINAASYLTQIYNPIGFSGARRPDDTTLPTVTYRSRLLIPLTPKLGSGGSNDLYMAFQLLAGPKAAYRTLQTCVAGVIGWSAWIDVPQYAPITARAFRVRMTGAGASWAYTGLPTDAAGTLKHAWLDGKNTATDTASSSFTIISNLDSIYAASVPIGADTETFTRLSYGALQLGAGSTINAGTAASAYGGREFHDPASDFSAVAGVPSYGWMAVVPAVATGSAFEISVVWNYEAILYPAERIFAAPATVPAAWGAMDTFDSMVRGMIPPGTDNMSLALALASTALYDKIVGRSVAEQETTYAMPASGPSHLAPVAVRAGTHAIPGLNAGLKWNPVKFAKGAIKGAMKGVRKVHQVAKEASEIAQAFSAGLLVEHMLRVIGVLRKDIPTEERPEVDDDPGLILQERLEDINFEDINGLDRKAAIRKSCEIITELCLANSDPSHPVVMEDGKEARILTRQFEPRVWNSQPDSNDPGFEWVDTCLHCGSQNCYRSLPIHHAHSIESLCIRAERYSFAGGQNLRVFPVRPFTLMKASAVEIGASLTDTSSLDAKQRAQRLGGARLNAEIFSRQHNGQTSENTLVVAVDQEDPRNPFPPSRSCVGTVWDFCRTTPGAKIVEEVD